MGEIANIGKIAKTKTELKTTRMTKTLSILAATVI